MAVILTDKPILRTLEVSDIFFTRHLSFEKLAEVVFASNVFMSRFCSCTVCLLTTCAEFLAISV